MLFSELGLCPEILRALDERGYTTPTPIQEKSIPVIVEGKDLLATAQTGTGKTAGFVLPILQRLSEKKQHHTRALILTPTRELAAQVEENIQRYAKFLNLNSFCVYGGVGFYPQIQKLRRRVDILVATPGRLLDHVQQKTCDLTKVEVLVLDEADLMLDMGFIRDIRKLIEILPKECQSLLFSATFSRQIKELANSFLKQPTVIEMVAEKKNSDLISQKAIRVSRSKKPDLLAHLIKEQNWKQSLVFTRTKHGADRLVELLNQSQIPAQAIHGNKSQVVRTHTLNRFKDGKIQVLVATDVASRGIDINELPHVVNFDLPEAPEDYVHRIGRTGRAGMKGEAISFVSDDETKLLRGIERHLQKNLPTEVVVGFEPPVSSGSSRGGMGSGSGNGGGGGRGRFGGGGGGRDRDRDRAPQQRFRGREEFGRGPGAGPGPSAGPGAHDLTQERGPGSRSRSGEGQGSAAGAGAGSGDRNNRRDRPNDRPPERAFPRADRGSGSGNGGARNERSERSDRSDRGDRNDRPYQQTDRRDQGNQGRPSEAPPAQTGDRAQRALSHFEQQRTRGPVRSGSFQRGPGAGPGPGGAGPSGFDRNQRMPQGPQDQRGRDESNRGYYAGQGAKKGFAKKQRNG